MTQTILIIGAGQAGASVASHLANLDKDYRIRLLGDEKYLPYQRPPLSKGLLRGIVPATSLRFHSEEFYIKKGISVQLSSGVERIDPSVNRVFTGSEEISYDSLVLATGGRARQLDIADRNIDNIHFIRSLDDALLLKEQLSEGKRLAVIGGGFIGLETAATAKVMGCDVTVLEVQPRLLSRVLPETVSDAVMAAHIKRGVEFYTDISVKAIEQAQGNHKVIHLQDGRCIEADLIVIGAGMVPECKLAQESGIKVDNGIVVDQYCRTSQENIYAAGDCARTFLPRYQQYIRLESFQNAKDQGQAVALNIVGANKPYDPIPFVWSDQFDLNLQIVGLPQCADSYLVRGSAVENNLLTFALAGDKLISVIGFGKAPAVAKNIMIARKIIEAGIRVDASLLADEKTPLTKILENHHKGT